MDNFLCKKGFILTPSPSDEEVMVPFFVQVRDKDIIWSENDFPKEIYNIAMSGYDPSNVTPVKALKFIQDGWNITFNQDFTYVAYKKISICGSGRFEINKKRDTLIGNLDLPFKSKTGISNISLICTLEAYDETMASSALSSYIDNNNDSNATQFKIYIRNIDGKYPKKFMFDESIANSFVNVLIHGKYTS